MSVENVAFKPVASITRKDLLQRLARTVIVQVILSLLFAGVSFLLFHFQREEWMGVAAILFLLASRPLSTVRRAAGDIQSRLAAIWPTHPAPERNRIDFLLFLPPTAYALLVYLIFKRDAGDSKGPPWFLRFPGFTAAGTIVLTVALSIALTLSPVHTGGVERFHPWLTPMLAYVQRLFRDVRTVSTNVESLRGMSPDALSAKLNTEPLATALQSTLGAQMILITVLSPGLPQIAKGDDPRSVARAKIERLKAAVGVVENWEEKRSLFSRLNWLYWAWPVHAWEGALAIALESAFHLYFQWHTVPSFHGIISRIEGELPEFGQETLALKTRLEATRSDQTVRRWKGR